MKRPKGFRRSKWWHLPRSVRKRYGAWARRYARLINSAIGSPAREWFKIEILPDDMQVVEVEVR